MNILVTGGAGYIGSHTVAELLKAGHQVIAYDNLVHGKRESVPANAIFIESDLCDAEKLDEVFSQHAIDAVMHFAAFIDAGESVREPLKYYQNNVANSLVLFSAMLKHNVMRLIFSSSAAVYGTPSRIPITEDDPVAPINPYGESKLMVEEMLRSFDAAYGLRSISLRYFNAAGSSLDGSRGESLDGQTHLIPLVLKVALGKERHITVFGTDYPTPDGSCIRDYIHVMDLARGHLMALDALASGSGTKIYNLGSGHGYSVKEVIAACREVTGQRIPAIAAGRRPGDPATLVASADKIRRELGWEAQHSDLRAIIESSWKWIKKQN